MSNDTLNSLRKQLTFDFMLDFTVELTSEEVALLTLFENLDYSGFGILMFLITFFRGDIPASVFANDTAVIDAAAQYLKAYGIDCLLTCFLFCFIGFFNGMGYTRFVMVQGIIGAFCIRIPVAFFMSRQDPVSLFHVGLATPCSTLVQIIMCFICFAIWQRRNAEKT